MARALLLLTWAAVAAAAPSAACPEVEQGSLQVCDRCVHNDLCPFDDKTSTRLVCDPFAKKCFRPEWNASEGLAACPEDPRDPSTWSAQCKLSCTDQQAPYGCAVNYCLNEDFPCNWAPGCGIPDGLVRTSLACLRSCDDHGEMLRTAGYGVDDCSKAVSKLGCSGLWEPIKDFCPVSCDTIECSWRCTRDEVPNLNQRRCWQMVEKDGLSCVDAIRQGQDCHCKCAHSYFRMAGAPGRAQGGAFKVSDKIDEVQLSLDMKAIVGRTLTIDFTGERMRSEDVGHGQGPRMKIIPDGQLCGREGIAFNVTGLECQQPPDAGPLSGFICTTPPSLATEFLHRWGGIVVNACGKYMLCHCNEKCDVQSNWARAGYLEVEPVINFNTMANPLPGCDVYMPTLPPATLPDGPSEVSQKSLVTTYVSLEGGIRAIAPVLQAVAEAFAAFAAVRSELLGAEVPTPQDVEVEDYESRGLVRRLHGRRAQTCADDDAAFASEAVKAGLTTVESCDQAMTLLGNKDTLCADQTLEQAVLAGCQQTCGLCVAQTTSVITTPAPAAATTTEPEVTWPGDSSSIHLVVSITCRTNLVRDYVMSQLELIKTDPAQLLVALYRSLEDAGISGSDIPGQMWAYVALGPLAQIAPPDTTTTEPPPTWTANTTIMVTLISVIAGSVVISCVCVGLWMYYQNEKYAVRVGTADEEVVERSEGGYRTKRKIIPGQAPNESQAPARPSCLERCCNRLCPKKKVRRIAPVAQDSGGSLVLGARVRLVGLSQAHFNGLEGFITGGPNDKGRYTVDVIVDDDEMVREMQTLSFKPDNLLVLPPENANANLQVPGRGPSSYRGGA